MLAGQGGPEQGRIQKDAKHRPKLSLGAAARRVFPRQHGRLDEVLLGRRHAVGEVIAGPEVVVDEEATQLHDDELLGERQVRHVSKDLVALLHGVGLVVARAEGDAIGTTRPRRSKARWHTSRTPGQRVAYGILLVKKILGPGIVSIRAIAQGPFPDEVRDGGLVRGRWILEHGAAGRKGVPVVHGRAQLGRPPGPHPGQLDDVTLVIAIVRTHAEQLAQLACIVLVGDLVAPFGQGPARLHGIEVNDHCGALRADPEQFMERDAWF